VGSGSDPPDLEPEVDDVLSRARAGEKIVIDALRDMVLQLCFCNSVLSNLVNPEVVILGGY
jgi:predicted NBD/HSP70 family sugar kinase